MNKEKVTLLKKNILLFLKLEIRILFQKKEILETKKHHLQIILEKEEYINK